jgi:hypothetical protein
LTVLTFYKLYEAIFLYDSRILFLARVFFLGRRRCRFTGSSIHGAELGGYAVVTTPLQAEMVKGLSCPAAIQTDPA